MVGPGGRRSATGASPLLWRPIPCLSSWYRFGGSDLKEQHVEVGQRVNKIFQHKKLWFLRDAWIFLRHILLACLAGYCPLVHCFMQYLLNIRQNDGKCKQTCNNELKPLKLWDQSRVVNLCVTVPDHSSSFPQMSSKRMQFLLQSDVLHATPTTSCWVNALIRHDFTKCYRYK